MKRMLYSVAVMLFVVFSAASTAAENRLSRPTRIVIGFPPGGGADNVARILGEALGKILNTPVIVENRPGAGTTLAPPIVAGASPDGHTLLMAHQSLFGADKVLFDQVKYDEKSFTPITRLVSTFFVLAVNKDAGIKRVSDLIAKARQAPMSVASTGGPLTHMIIASFNKLGGTKLVLVPYKGGAPAVIAAASGEVPMTFAVPTSVMPLAQPGGRLVALAITAPKRSPLTPGVPALAEEGLPGFDVTYWFGLSGPAGMPEKVVQRLFDAIQQALNDPAIPTKFATLGYETTPSKSPAEFRASALRDGHAMLKVVQSLGLKGQ